MSMNDLDQLKELLFGAEKEALDSIAERVERPEVRAADVADILPEAIHRRHRKDKELVESLTEPVGECLQQAFRDDPQTYGDALYPVMGPAIRKSIMHALRTFAQQINEAVEHSVSPKGLKWRWQASRAGIPFGEFVLQKTLRYRVEQAYLISRENGLLMGHVHHEASKIKDSDAVSAMFTAIQDFVKESFSPDRTGRLESADMGEFTLWAVHGPHALLVCVIRGVPPRSLRGDLSAVLERIHFRYGEVIREYKGDTSSIPDVEVELERCLRFEAREEKGERRERVPIVLIIVSLLLVAGAAFLGMRSWSYSQQLQALGSALDDVPGIHVTSLERDGGQFQLRGLRDPLAKNLESVAADLDIDAARIEASMQPFQSLEPDIVVTRAERLFGQPGDVRYEVADRTLRVSGDAPSAWKESLEARFAGFAGVDQLDMSGLKSTDLEQLLNRVTQLDNRRFYFEEGAELAANDEEALRAYAQQIGELVDDARAMGREIRVTVTGSTDMTGGERLNAELANSRADVAAVALAAVGIESERQVQRPEMPQGGVAEVDARSRYVQVNLALQPTPP